jgi:hypothetical protein
VTVGVSPSAVPEKTGRRSAVLPGAGDSSTTVGGGSSTGLDFV